MYEDHSSHDQVAAGVGPHRLGHRPDRIAAVLLQVLTSRLHPAPTLPFALLSRREFLKVDYRGLEQILREWAESRHALGLEKVPDHSTIQKAATRRLEDGGAMPSSGRPSPRRGRAA